MDLLAPVDRLPGVGPTTRQKLANLGITTIFDLLYHLPSRYEDRRLVSMAATVQAGETVSLLGTVAPLKIARTKNGKQFITTAFTDTSGSIPVVWFNQTYLLRAIPPATPLLLYGKVSFFGRKPALISPQYTIGGTPQIVPIYPLTAGITSAWLHKHLANLLPTLPPDILPEDLVQKYHLLPWRTALEHIHFPTDLADTTPARSRLAFDELFLSSLVAHDRRSHRQKLSSAHALLANHTDLDHFVGTLPFALTPSQTKAISDISSDLASPHATNRLLQGDVGSGKTIVAAALAFQTFTNHKQTLIVAPTQLVAHQHHQTLTTLFTPYNIPIGLVTGQSKLATTAPIVVGTHALLNPQLDLSNVGLIVIDEQHRFGVAQRGWLSAYNVLTMTATPIPRTMSLTLFGDLDLTALTDLPPGRQPVKTWIVPETKRDSMVKWLNDQMTKYASQAFWLCPFIDPSESAVSIKSATTQLETIKQAFPTKKVGLLHGRLKPTDKDRILDHFRAGDLDILVATPIVEVGVDIPNAHIMVIESADHFGLAQLHQLRGRVGRSGAQSYCLLFSSTVESTPRLEAMQTHHLGSELAEIDLKLRGPGDLFGLRQHGEPSFRVATYPDFVLIPTAHQLSDQLAPDLASHPLLLQLVKQAKMDLVSPN